MSRHSGGGIHNECVRLYEWKGWRIRAFDEGIQIDGESEEDGMEGKWCARGECHL